jgi:hypothetical protein
MSDQFAHPESEEDLVGLVQEAVRQGPQLRVRGPGTRRHTRWGKGNVHVLGDRERCDSSSTRLSGSTQGSCC